MTLIERTRFSTRRSRPSSVVPEEYRPRVRRRISETQRIQQCLRYGITANSSNIEDCERMQLDLKRKLDILHPGMSESLEELYTGEESEMEKKMLLGGRRFEISKNLLSVSKCPVCLQIGIEDHEQVALKKLGSAWTVSKTVFSCSCQQCIRKEKYSVSWKYFHNLLIDEISQTLVCDDCFPKIKKREAALGAIENLFSHAQVPSCLQQLTYAEEAAIARISVITNAKRLKSGARLMKGHSAFLMHDNHNLIENLPRLPRDLSIILVERKSSKTGLVNTLRVRRGVIRDALTFLLAKSPAYSDVRVSEDVLSMYPNDGFLTFTEDASVQSDDETLVFLKISDCCANREATNIVLDDELAQSDSDEDDDGPAPLQSSNLTPDEGMCSSEDLVNERIAETTEESIANMLVPENERVRTVMQDKYLPFQDVPYFFSKAFPTLFTPNESIDCNRFPGRKEITNDFKISSGRSNSLSFKEWIDLLMRAPDGRFVRHPGFKFALLNLKQREMMLMQSRGAIRMEENEEVPNVDELKQIFLNPANEREGRIIANRYMHRISTRGSTVQGSTSYFFEKKSEFDHFILAKNDDDDEFPVLFHSSSFAEFHDSAFHRLLLQYLTLTGQESFLTVESNGYSSVNINKETLSKSIINNLNVVNEYFVKRTEKFFHFVLKEQCEITDYLIRFEFAKSRGMIHYHSILYAKWHKEFHSILNPCVTAKTIEELNEREAQCAQNLESFLFNKIGLTTMHPGGTDDDDIVGVENDVSILIQNDKPTELGNRRSFPFPEGCAFQDEHVLRKNFFEIPCNEQSRKADLIHVVNRTMLHSCSKGYCAKDSKKIGNNCEECRFGFKFSRNKVWKNGKIVSETLISEGKTLKSCAELDSTSSMVKLRTACNHPRIVAYSGPLAQVLRCNADFTPIIAPYRDSYFFQDVRVRSSENDEVAMVQSSRPYFNKDIILQGIMKYIVSYACKAEMSVSQLHRAFKSIILKSSDTATHLTIGARLGNALLKQRMIPSNEAVFLLQGLCYVRYSRSPKKVWLSKQFRLLKNAALLQDSIESEQPATCLGPFQKFMKRSQIESHQCFHTYIVEARLTHGVIQFPVYKNMKLSFTYPFDGFTMTSILLRRKPFLHDESDIFVSIEILKNRTTLGQSESDVFSLDESFVEFLHSTYCPNGLKKRIQRAKTSFGREQYQNCSTEESPRVEERAESLVVTLDTNDSHAQLFEASSDTSVAAFDDFDAQATHDGNHNFFPMSGEVIDDLRSSVHSPNLSLLPETNERISCESFSPTCNPGTANSEQKMLMLSVFRAMKEIFITGKLRTNLRLHVQGQAGTGKSFIINVLSFANDILFIALKQGNHKKAAAKIYCPTGSASSQVNGQTIHSGLKVNPQNKKGMSDEVISEMQERFKETKLLLIDEKSMIGLKLFGLLDEKLCIFMNEGEFYENFGHLNIIVLFGDFMQLPPVGDRPIFTDVMLKECEKKGRKAFLHFNMGFELVQSVRQRNDPALGSLLEKMRTGSCSESDWVSFSKRNIEYLDSNQKKEFQLARTIHAHVKNLNVQRQNEAYIRGFKNVVNALQKLNGSHVRHDSGKLIGMASVIPRVLTIAPGACIRLTANLFGENGPKCGLFNGAVGYVQEIVYDPRANLDPGLISTLLPDFLVIEFPGYKGVPFFEEECKKHHVPIFQKQVPCSRWCCSRTGFPIILYSATTIHKTQGMTIAHGEPFEKIVVHISEAMENRFPGIHYTAFSRVKRLQDLAFKGELSKEFMLSIGKTQAAQEQKNAIQMLRDLQPNVCSEDVDQEYIDFWEWVNELCITNEVHQDWKDMCTLILSSLK